jgi:dGTPase
MTENGNLYPNHAFRDVYQQILSTNRARDEMTLAPFASANCEALRLKEETVDDSDNVRPAFFHDTDRIIHCDAYARYIDKTQVFFEVDNDHVSRRVLHVQLVSKIGRTLGRFFRANEDLVEAIALGHDLGHTPFGHTGEAYLAEKLEAMDAGSFVHNAQSVRLLENIENKGSGLNLTLQVLDGILGHNGELFQQELHFDKTALSPDALSRATKQCLSSQRSNAPEKKIYPSTLEGAIVRLSDVLAFLGRDVEDAIVLRLIDRDDLPKDAAWTLGDNNRSIINNLVMDIVHHSRPEEGRLAFSRHAFLAMRSLYDFNMRRIYCSAEMETAKQQIRTKMHRLFDVYLDDLKRDLRSSSIFTVFLDFLPKGFRDDTMAERIVADHIAGMTDRYFNKEARNRLTGV